jgi:hypothetical protein
MFGLKFTTSLSSDHQILMSLPLSELGDPKHLPPLLEVVANEACACVAEGLINRFAGIHALRNRCQLDQAFSYTNRLVQVFS